MSGVLVPGWAAVAGLYAPGLPPGWEVLESPGFGPTRGDLGAYRRWLDEEIARRDGRISLAGHSMGASLAILAALERPASIERLILLSPAGLPLRKPLTASFFTFLGQILRGWYPWLALVRALGGILRAPRAALRLARTVHDLDLTRECESLRITGVSCTVVACTTDHLATPDHCRRLAVLLGAGYDEVDAPGGHIWMIAEPALLAAALVRDAA